MGREGEADEEMDGWTDGSPVTKSGWSDRQTDRQTDRKTDVNSNAEREIEIISNFMYYILILLQDIELKKYGKFILNNSVYIDKSFKSCILLNH